MFISSTVPTIDGILLGSDESIEVGYVADFFCSLSADTPSLWQGKREAETILMKSGEQSCSPLLACLSQQGTSPLQHFATPAAGAHSTLFPVASPALTPPTAFRKPRPHFATADDARVFLEVISLCTCHLCSSSLKQADVLLLVVGS